MLLEQTEAPSRRYWRVFAFAIGSILLAVAPAILSAFDDEIDRSLHIADAWPEFWTLLAQMEAWWFGGILLGAVLVAGRVMVNRLRPPARTVWYLLAATAWWLLLAVAPIVLTAAIMRLRINQRLGNSALRSEVDDLLYALSVIMTSCPYS